MLIWRIVLETKQPLSEVECWDLPTIWEASDILNMRADYNAASNGFDKKTTKV